MVQLECLVSNRILEETPWNTQKSSLTRPRERVQRITLNNPEKRNPITNEMRTEIFHALETADLDDLIRVTVIRGAGKCFSVRLQSQSWRAGCK